MCCELKTCTPDDLIKRVDIQLAQVTTGATSTPTLRFRVTNPSKKLHLTLQVYARPGNNGAGVSPAAHVYTGENWQLRAIIIDNPETVLNPAFVDSGGVATPRQLPDSYDVNDGVKAAYGDVTISSNGQPTGDIYKVVAIWEPIDCAMPYAERLYWFARCALSPEKNKMATVGNGS